MYAEDSYFYGNSLPDEANGIYFPTNEIEMIGKYKTINWKYIDGYESDIKNWFSVYEINNKAKTTIKGVSTDGFAVTKTEFDKWNIKKIKDGKIIDQDGYPYIRISEKLSNPSLSIMDIAMEHCWEILKGNMIIESNMDIKYSKNGFTYMGRNYKLLEPMYWMKDSKTYFSTSEKSPSKEGYIVIDQVKGEYSISSGYFKDEGEKITITKRIGTMELHIQ
jgi:hypothetical protein